MALKAVHIPGKLNTMMDKLSRLEMSRNYSLPRKTFQFIQETLRCYPNTFTPTFDLTVRYNFLQKKIAIFLGFFLKQVAINNLFSLGLELE
jgi:hypothetical protein